MDQSSKPTELPAMFRPPVNRAMRVLDRSFFRKMFPLSAATIFKNSDISNVRKDLTKGQDLLSLPRLNVIREVKEDDVVRKCLLLREDIKYDGEFLLNRVGWEVVELKLTRSIRCCDLVT